MLLEFPWLEPKDDGTAHYRDHALVFTTTGEVLRYLGKEIYELSAAEMVHYEILKSKKQLNVVNYPIISSTVVLLFFSVCCVILGAYLNRRASRSHSNKHKISPSRTGPFTLRMIERVGSSKNSTRT